MRSKDNDLKFNAKSPKELGMRPVKEFRFRSITFASESLPSDEGIVPTNLLMFSAMFSIDDRSPNELGTELEKQLENT